MPVERGPRISAKSAIVVGVAGIVAGVGLFALVLYLANTGGVEVQLGDDVFRAGDTERIATEIDDRGPVLYSDVAGGSRDLWLQHLGDDPQEGWFAFAAREPGSPRECQVVWEADREVFRDPCSDTELPADGTGLPQYPVILEDDGATLVIDINRVRGDTTTTR